MNMQIRRLSNKDLTTGCKELSARDPDLAEIRSCLGVPPLWGRRPGFSTLVQIILEQQVSLSAARTVYRRLRSELGGMTPDLIFTTKISGLRKFGLTRQKSRYCFCLAEMILDDTLDLSDVARYPDHLGREMLLSVPGIGPWSVDIYYLMALRRPDIWPRGDLALPAALKEIKKLGDSPTQDEQEDIASAWSPWRSVAARLLWAHYLDARGRYEQETGK